MKNLLNLIYIINLAKYKIKKRRLINLYLNIINKIASFN